MENIKHILLIFVVVQSNFIVLDCFELWRQHGRPNLAGFLRAHRGSVFFLVGVWLSYFVIQNLLMLAMPSMEATIRWFSDGFKLDRSDPRFPVTSGLWVVGPLFASTFFVAGFWDYWVHRLQHTRPFWFLHENHHLPTQVFKACRVFRCGLT